MILLVGKILQHASVTLERGTQLGVFFLEDVHLSESGVLLLLPALEFTLGLLHLFLDVS